MAIFTRAQSNPQFPTNLPNPNFQFKDMAPTLDSVFEMYMRSKQNQRAEQLAGQQSLVAQGQLDAQKDEAALRGAQQTAQFGAPISSFSPQQVSQAALGQEAPAPYNNDMAAKLNRLRDGLAKLGGRDPQTLAAQGLKVRGAEAEVGKTEAEAAKLRAEAGALPAQRGMKAEGELRGELQKLSKPFIDVRDAYSRIQNVSKNPGEAGAGDLAIIFNYMKMLDPGSTVREGEFANAQNSGGVPDRIIALHNKLVKGDRLSETQRRDFIERADELYQSQLGSQRRNEEQYRGLAGRMGANPQNVILDQGLPAQPTQGGTVKIQLPDGRMGNIPAANLEAALKRGARRL